MSSRDIIKGISKLVNKTNVKSGINIEEIENSLVNQDSYKNTDPKVTFDEQLQKYMKELNITLDDEKSKSMINNRTIKSPSKLFNDDNMDDDIASDVLDKNDNDIDNSRNINNKKKLSNNYRHFQYGDDTDDINNADDTNNADDADDADDVDDVDDADDADDTNYFNKANDTANGANYSRLYRKPETELERRTEEQYKRETINKVMGQIEGGGRGMFSIEKERLEDTKANMLEEIDSLRMSLEEDDVDISRVPTVTQTSSHDEIENVLKILRLKNDRMRYCSFAEEFLLCGAHGLEEVFNGKRMFLGRYKPDLTGWHTQVNTKLRRMRHDTSTLVSGVMHDYNIGPGARILLELVPNMVMYSKMRKQQYGTPSMYMDDEIAGHLNNIRTIDER